MIRRAILVWVCVLFLAITNGALRELVIAPRIGSQPGHIVSTILLSVFILAAAWLAIGWIGPRTPGRSWVVGTIWLTLTLAFEFLAGHYLFGTSWNELGAAAKAEPLIPSGRKEMETAGAPCGSAYRQVAVVGSTCEDRVKCTSMSRTGQPVDFPSPVRA